MPKLTRLVLLGAMRREAAAGSVFHQEALIELERLYAIEDAATPPRHLSDKAEVVEGCFCTICQLHRKSA